MSQFEKCELMKAAAILATKPGGLTLSEAAICGLPMVLFDHIPGPEDANATRFVQAGAAVTTENPHETAAKILSLIKENKAPEASIFPRGD